MNSRDHFAGNPALRRQCGAYAVEYALIFPIFFALMYASILYGVVLTTRLSLQHAAEEGARAALRFQQTVAGGPSQLDLRIIAAESTAATQAAWLNDSPTIQAFICRTDVQCPGTLGAAEPAPDCGEDLSESCQIVVVVTYDYAANPLVPELLGFGLLAPDNLQGRARVLLDGRTLGI